MFVFLLVTWIRWSFVRIRVDQILRDLVEAAAAGDAAAAPRDRGRRRAGGPRWLTARATASDASRCSSMRRRRARAMRITLHQPVPQAGDGALPGQAARPYPDRYRGLLALIYDKETGEENCIGCRLCEFICPPAVIKVEMLKARSGTTPRPSRSSSTPASSASCACRSARPTPSS